MKKMEKKERRSGMKEKVRGVKDLVNIPPQTPVHIAVGVPVVLCL
jgi:hypothetical protein